MDRASRQRLAAIYREGKGADAEAGPRWIDEIGSGKRYVLDGGRG
jgi:cytochrome P450/NADPH-cytochrome P450 reductase